MKAYKLGTTYKLVKQTAQGTLTKTFNSGTSLQAWTVPTGVTSLTVDCAGAKGTSTDAAGGKGGRVQCKLAVTSGQTLYFTVGTSGTNSSRPDLAYYNASDIRTNNAGVTDTTSLNSRLLVAGGGGNAGRKNNGQSGTGGDGGGTTGGTGQDERNCTAGVGGSQSAGGAAGTGNYRAGSTGTLGLGGAGGRYSGEGGAGGAGYYGGGGGGNGGDGYWYGDGAGGGGGSSWTSSSCSNVTHTRGYNDNTGYITISYIGNIDTYKAFNT